jgi:hypothetical protein
MKPLKHAAAAATAVLIWAPAALAEVRGAAALPAFTPAEQALIGRDAKLAYAAKVCPRQLRQALDAWNDIRRGVPPEAEPEPCRDPDDDLGRASDEAALDILKIIKEAAGQGTSR